MTSSQGLSAGSSVPFDYEMTDEDFVMVNLPLPQCPSAPPLAAGESSVPYHPRWSTSKMRSVAQDTSAKLETNGNATAIDLEAEGISRRDFAKEAISNVESKPNATTVHNTNKEDGMAGATVGAKDMALKTSTEDVETAVTVEGGGGSEIYIPGWYQVQGLRRKRSDPTAWAFAARAGGNQKVHSRK